MAGYDFWVNTQIDIETARSPTPLNITAISKANPAVMSYTGTDPAAGDKVALTVNGMTQLNGRVVRLLSVDTAANTAVLEGVDSTLFDTFIAGTSPAQSKAEVVTLGASMTTVQDLNPSGGEYEYADLTTVHDGERKRAPTVSSPFSLVLGCLFKPEDAAHLELEEANDNKSVRVVQIRWPSGRKLLFQAYVGAAGIPTGSAQDVVKTSVSFEGQGKRTIYST